MNYYERFRDYLDKVNYTDNISLPFILIKSNKIYEAMYSYRVRNGIIIDLGKLALLEVGGLSPLIIEGLIDVLTSESIVNIFKVNENCNIDENEQEEYLSLYEQFVGEQGIVADETKIKLSDLEGRIFEGSEAKDIYKSIINDLG